MVVITSRRSDAANRGYPSPWVFWKFISWFQAGVRTRGAQIIEKKGTFVVVL